MFFESTKRRKETNEVQNQLTFDHETYNIVNQIKSKVIARYNELIKEES